MLSATTLSHPFPLCMANDHPCVIPLTEAMEEAAAIRRDDVDMLYYI